MTPDEYKALYPVKHKRNYRAIEDKIILAEIIPYLNLWTNNGRLKCYWTKIANETIVHSIQIGTKLKRMGKKAGVPDYMFIKDSRIYFVEIKQPDGKLSEAQREFKKMCERENVPFCVAHDSKEIEIFLNQCGLLI